MNTDHVNEPKTMGAYALDYGALGWRVFPCHTIRDGLCTCGKPDCSSPGKHPHTENGLKDATTGTEQITRWWNQWPDANIAYAPDANTVIVDVDIGHGADKHGDETLAALEAKYGKLPDTVVSLTGGGGWHCFYHTDKVIRNGTNVLPGIDVRTAGGYIILPPSTHISGNIYKWDAMTDETDNIAPLPGWLYKELTTKKDKRKAPVKDEAIKQGTRNETLFKLASSLRAKGLSEAAVMAALSEENKVKCNPPLSKDEVKKIAESAAVYQPNETKEKDYTQAHALINLVMGAGAEFFHSDLGDPYATIPVDGHREIWPIDDRSFKTWLHGVYYKETGRPVNGEAVTQVVSTLSAAATFDAPEPVTLSTRVTAKESAFWYDLTNPAWQAVKVDTSGWSVVDNPPILFSRYPHQAAQAVPAHGGDPAKILKYVNLKEQQTLFLCWLISCFIPDIPHAMPIFYGEKGAAKSTACAILKAIIDPSKLETVTLQADPRSLVVNLQQHWFSPFDNVSRISGETSDIFCRAITGGGIQQRKLFTNAEDVVFSFKRCLAINGINNVANRSDLLDRSLLVELERIPEGERRELVEVMTAFEEDRASILGGILDTLSAAKRIHPTVKLDKKPRMADFARWGYAIGEALGGLGQTFLDEYTANRAAQNAEAINSDPVALLTVEFMQTQGRHEWEGTVTELYAKLKEMAGAHGINTNNKAFPTQPNSLSRRLSGIKSNLEAVGIVMDKRHTMYGNFVTLKRA